jgi:predicted Fe-Mo cluster-binding NifX family protein
VIGMRIAIASSDGENVDLHFGKANSLYIYDFDGNKTTFVEHRTVNLNLDEKHQWRYVLNANLDCNIIIDIQFGFKSSFGIEKAGLKKIADHGTVDEVLKHYIDHYKFMNTL